jgi:4-aminobutyrate aminotransferase-like enzyme
VDDLHTQADPRSSRAIREQDHRYIARPTRRIPLVIATGQGATLVDVDGRRFIDLTSGWNVANTGWNHPHVVAAVRGQLAVGAFAPPWCSHPGRPRYGRELSDWLGGEWAAWCGASGSEAVEAALKIARRATGRHPVVGFAHAYHGGTLGSMLAGGVPALHGVDLPPGPYHRHAPMPDPLRGADHDYARLAREVILADPAPAAVLLEPLFTNPGVISGGTEFYESVARAATEAGALVVVDEIGTGFGRTGRRFGFQHTTLTPDIVVIGKAMASGMVPMSAALMKPDLAAAITGPGFSATFAWIPLACAAATATLTVLDEENLVERCAQLGARARALLTPLVSQCEHVAAVRGQGLEIGIELVTPQGDPIAPDTIELLLQRLLMRGVFAESSAYTSTLLIMPPLIILEDQLDGALRIVMEEISAMPTGSPAGG